MRIVVTLPSFHCQKFEDLREIADHYGVAYGAVVAAHSSRKLLYGDKFIFTGEDLPQRGGEPYLQGVMLPRAILDYFVKEERYKYQEVLRESLQDTFGNSKRLYRINGSMEILEVYNSYLEASRKMDIPIGTVRSRVARALNSPNPTLIRAGDFIERIKGNQCTQY